MTNFPLDQSAPVRAGEALDVARLGVFLATKLSGDGVLTVAQFPGGMSNLTYALRVGERELVLRRPPFGAHVRGGHDMSREFRILTALQLVFPRVPAPVLFCDDESVLGAPFYLMERVPGVILRNPLPHGVDLVPAQMHAICLALIDTLVELHTLDYTAAGLGDLGRPEGYTARQVAGWAKRYDAAHTDDCPDFAPIIGWLTAHTPAHSDAALIHNDFRYDNVILDPADLTQVVAVLDWELATIGDPLTDLGTTLAYWAEPGDPAALRDFSVTTLPGNLDRQQVVDRYAERSGRDTSAMLFYYIYGLFKNAVIALQIYARYRQGLTSDVRFAGLIGIIRVWQDLAERAIKRDQVSNLFS